MDVGSSFLSLDFAQVLWRRVLCRCWDFVEERVSWLVLSLGMSISLLFSMGIDR